MNFMKSVANLVYLKRSQNMIKCLRIYTFGNIVVFIAYSILLIIIQDKTDEDILTCKYPEFIIEELFLAVILIIFFCQAVKVTKEINKETEHYESLKSGDKRIEHNDETVNESRK